MRKIIIVLLLGILISLPALTQDNEPDINEVFLFDHFEDGTANVIKQGIIKTKFNLGTVSQKMFFLNGNEIMELGNPATTPIINIGDRTFEHVKNGIYYERVQAGDNYFYIGWKTKVRSQNIGAFGVKSEAGGIQNISHFATTEMDANRGQRLEIKANLINRTADKYYIKVKNNFKEFTSFNSLANIFKKDKEEIKEYFKTEELDFKNLDDLQKAVEYVSKYIEK